MKRIGRLLLAGVCMCVLVSGAVSPEAPITPGEDLIADAPLQAPPLSVRIDYEDGRSQTGFGSLDLSADPAYHEFRVNLLLGGAHERERWKECGSVQFSIDGLVRETPGEYHGVAMTSGVYDSLRSRLTISDVRAMSQAEQVEAIICQDRFVIPESRLESLRDFVERFEDLATDDGPSLPPPPLELDFTEHPAFRHEAQIPLPA